MVIKFFRIIKKVVIIIYKNRNNKPLEVIYNSFLRYKKGGRKELTKGINNDYKALFIVEKSLYLDWIENNEFNQDFIDIALISFKPLISIVIPTYNTSEIWLEKAINSVLNQSYTNWELCIADDCSTNIKSANLLKKYEQKHTNIKVNYRNTNGHISKSSNSALALAYGEYIAFMDHDDELSVNALYEVVKTINQNKNIKLIYSDEDKIDEQGKRFDPHFKSDWNPDMFFSQNYISHLTVIKKNIIDKTEKFRVGYEGSQDYDLLLQCLKFIEDDEIHHISKILYHWRAIEGSTALHSNEKSYTTEAGIKALKSYFKHTDVEQGLVENTYKIKYTISSIAPLVTIIIPTRDGYDILYQCIESILTKTDYSNYEIIIIDNQSSDMKTLKYLKVLTKKHQKIRVLKYLKPFNYSSINNYAVKHANGDILALVNNDIEVINSSWLTELVQHAQRDDIGAVGAKLYYPDETIQHGGVVLGIGGVAGHSHRYFQKDDYGYFSRLQIIQNYSAVTGACLVVRKKLYEEVNGLDEKNLSIAFNDVDFCLASRKRLS